MDNFSSGVPKAARAASRDTSGCHGSPRKKNYEGRVSLSRVNRNEWQSTFRNGRNAAPMAVSKSQRHPEMARLKSQSRVESLRVDAGVMGERFDQLPPPGACSPHLPLHHPPSDAPS